MAKPKQANGRKGLTPRQRRFVDAYLRDPNATRAAIKAGYSESGAAVEGSRLLRNPKVAPLIAKAESRAAQNAEISATEILRELKRIGLADLRQAFDASGRLRPIHEIPEDVARAMSGIEVEELWEAGVEGSVRTGSVRKVKFWDKNKALDSLGKHLKLFTEVIEHKHSWQDLVDGSLDEAAE